MFSGLLNLVSIQCHIRPSFPARYDNHSQLFKPPMNVYCIHQPIDQSINQSVNRSVN